MSKTKRAPARATAETAESKPQGSAYDAATERRKGRKLSRRIKGWFSTRAVGFVAAVFPYLYYAYCWLVWKTNRIDDQLSAPLNAAADRHGGFLALLWHQEVFTVAYAYQHLNGHTIASTGNFGRIVTRLLELCNFTVFRGGSSGGTARRRRVALDMIRHYQREPRVPYGITVDGSRGPAYEMKSGGAVIARACRAPVYLCRCWYIHAVSLPTWDRTAIPLPTPWPLSGRIKTYAVGPYWIDPDGGAEELEQAVEHLQDELRNLAHLSYHEIEGRPYFGPAPEGFPEGWRPRWQPGQLGLKRTRWDLDPESPPPWAATFGNKGPSKAKASDGS